MTAVKRQLEERGKGIRGMPVMGNVSVSISNTCWTFCALDKLSVTPGSAVEIREREFVCWLIA